MAAEVQIQIDDLQLSPQRELSQQGAWDDR